MTVTSPQRPVKIQPPPEGVLSKEDYSRHIESLVTQMYFAQKSGNGENARVCLLQALEVLKSSPSDTKVYDLLMKAIRDNFEFNNTPMSSRRFRPLF